MVIPLEKDTYFAKNFQSELLAQEIFRISNEFFTTHGIYWSNCISVCADGASAMMGADKRSAA